MDSFHTGNVHVNDQTRKVELVRLFIGDWAVWSKLDYPLVRADENVSVKQLTVNGIVIQFFGERRTTKGGET